jgi:hypothetical protein
MGRVLPFKYFPGKNGTRFPGISIGLMAISGKANDSKRFNALRKDLCL